MMNNLFAKVADKQEKSLHGYAKLSLI